MFLESLGWNQRFEHHFLQSTVEGKIAARVSEELKGAYHLLTECGEMFAHIAGKARFRAQERADFPTVGDWVIARRVGSENRAIIASILPRQTVLSRKMAGRKVQEQVLAANLDIVFVVTSLNQELNFRRLERYLSLVWKSRAIPIVLLTKADLSQDSEISRLKVQQIAPGVDVCVLSALTGLGMESVRRYLSEGRTAAFIGSSGVGKSTIINALTGGQTQKVNTIRQSDDRGRHTTTCRQMLLLPSRGIVIDSPGMRELQLWDGSTGLSQAFQDLEDLSVDCKFRDCRHSGEPGCAVTVAIEEGRFSPERFRNYEKLQAELRFVERKTNVHQREEAKRHAKRMCKAQRRHYNKR